MSKGSAKRPGPFSFLEKGTPLEQNPSEWFITKIDTPLDQDLSLGYSYEATVGMNAAQATELYQEIIEKLGREVMTFPYNYSLSDGLLYLGHHQREDIRECLNILAPA